MVAWIRLDSLGVEDERREDDDTDDEEVDEEGKFIRACRERGYEYFEPGWMTYKLEHPRDSHQTEIFEYVTPTDEKFQMESESCYEIENVDRFSDEVQFPGTDQASDGQFEREPGVTNVLDVQDGDYRFRGPGSYSGAGVWIECDRRRISI